MPFRGKSKIVTCCNTPFVLNFDFVRLGIGPILLWFMEDFPQTHSLAGRGLIQTGLCLSTLFCQNFLKFIFKIAI